MNGNKLFKADDSIEIFVVSLHYAIHENVKIVSVPFSHSEICKQRTEIDEVNEAFFFHIILLKYNSSVFHSLLSHEFVIKVLLFPSINSSKVLRLIGKNA